jgi:hypothetical protein
LASAVVFADLPADLLVDDFVVFFELAGDDFVVPPSRFRGGVTGFPPWLGHVQ